MAKKPIDTPLPDIYDDDWTHNPKDPNGLGYSGKAIREALQNKFRENDARLERLEEEVGGGSVDFRFVNLPSGKVYVNGSAPYPFPLHIKSVLVYKNDEGEEIEEEYDRNVHLDLEVILNGNSVTTSLGNVAANRDITVNITPYVADGAAFALRAYNDTGNNKRTSYYDVVKANMGLTTRDNSWWAAPFVAGKAWSVPLSLNVNVAAELKATLTKDGTIYASKTDRSLSANYDLVLDHPSLNGGGNGIYELKVELRATDENLSELMAEPLVYNVCVTEQGDNTNYVIVNNIGSGFKNYTTNRLFDYSVRVGFGNPLMRIIAKEGEDTIADTGDMTVSAGAVRSYNLSVDMERMDDADFLVGVVATLGGEVALSRTFTFSNKEGYAATSGASLSIRFNGRTNSESSRGVWYNAIGNEAITPQVTGVGYTGADGYKTEELADGTTRTFFRVLAGGRVVLPKKILEMSANQGRTIEFLYRVRNVRDFDSHVISCFDGTNGMYATASEIALFTPSAQVHDDQNAGIDYTELMHAIIVVRPQPNYGSITVDNFNAIMVYLNGCRQRWFSYTKDMNVDEYVTFGSDFADIDICAIRTYDKVLSDAEIEQNTCNFLGTEAEKAAYKKRNAVREGGKVNFNLVRSMCNVIVFGCNELPSRTWSKEQTTEATIETYMLGEDAKNEQVTNLAWQGTTSHNYGTNAEYGGLGQNYKWTATDGTKMCAKANWASSMQSHKIALTAAYTDLAVKCGIIPQGQRISILQKPMVGFQRKADGTLSFIGLFTVGADKGDKPTFGWTGKSIFMEGKDNEPLGTNFRVPWNDQTVTVDSSNETYSMVGDKAWEDASKKPDYINAKWKPAYNFVYDCMQYIRPIASLDALNALDASVNGGYAYWLTSGDGQYDLYYYLKRSATVGEWVTTGINLKDQLCDNGYGLAAADLDGKSDDEKNEMFKSARRVKFKKEVETKFSKDFALYHLCFILFFACTDNFSKNTYPFMLDATADDAVFCWRQDDLDSSVDIENQGKAYKKYCVEIMDNYIEYGRDSLQVYNGTDNQFWLLVREVYADEIDTFMREKFLPALQYGSASSPSAGFAQWCERYFFDNAQNHFPEALYNECGKLRYGYGHLSAGYQYRGIALSQDAGNHYYAEKQWLRMRHIYMSSKFMYGQFAAGSKTDVFSTRAYSDTVGNTFEITPAIYMYPSVQYGETGQRGFRIYPGEEQKTWTVTLPPPSGDQEQRINGMSYIKSLGSMYNAAITGKVDVNGRMLVELEMGKRGDKVGIRSTITGLGIGDATSLQKLTLSNLETLGGEVNLSVCENLKELYAEGTGITSLPLCDGGALNTIYFPSTLTQLELLGKQNVTTFDMPSYDNLVRLDVENCNELIINKVIEIIEHNYE